MRLVDVKELEWQEQLLGDVEMPREKLCLSAGFGSGLATDPAAPGPLVWAIGDRGPNLKLKDAVERYGWKAPAEWRDVPGTKLMPRPDVGPSLALLEVTDRSVRVRKTIRLTDGERQPISGLPVPDSGHAECEPVLDLGGKHHRPDPSGMDTEGIALLRDGSFWIGEEYGPSLIRVSPTGEVMLRLVPVGVALPGAGYPVRASLPALAGRRYLNRGFEALAVTPSNERLYLAFQSPLAHPDVAAHEAARHVRIWELDGEGGVIAQYAYRFDEPESFRRDNRETAIGRSDLKVCEITAIGERRVLVLERGSETSKIFLTNLDRAQALPGEHLDMATRPTLEELSAAGGEIPSLDKQLLFTSDDWPEVCADIEGMALIDERTLLIVSDNDFGCEGKQTRFYRLSFDQPLVA